MVCEGGEVPSLGRGQTPRGCGPGLGDVLHQLAGRAAKGGRRVEQPCAIHVEAEAAARGGPLSPTDRGGGHLVRTWSGLPEATKKHTSPVK